MLLILIDYADNFVPFWTLLLFFYSEEHLPMHVHVKNGDGKAKINIETAEVVENNGINLPT